MLSGKFFYNGTYNYLPTGDFCLQVSIALALMVMGTFPLT